MKRFAIALAVVATLLLLAPSAQADSITLKYTNVSPGQAANTSIGNVLAGVYNLQEESTNQIFQSFCVENTDAPNGYFAEYAILTLNEFADVYTQAAWVAQEFVTGGLSEIGADANARAAAAQLAIWELVFETNDTFNLADGSFSASNSTQQANANSVLGMLPVVDSNLEAFLHSNWRVIRSPADQTDPEDPQDYLIRVPEPTSAFLVGAAVASLVAVRRRRT